MASKGLVGVNATEFGVNGKGPVDDGLELVSVAGISIVMGSERKLKTWP